MPQVRVRRVLEQIESDMGPAMHNALRSVAPNAQIDARMLVRAFRNELEGRAPSWVEVRDNYVQNWSPPIPAAPPDAAAPHAVPSHADPAPFWARARSLFRWARPRAAHTAP